MVKYGSSWSGGFHMSFWKDGSILAIITVVLVLVAAIYTSWVIIYIAVVPALGSSILALRNHHRKLSQGK